LNKQKTYNIPLHIVELFLAKKWVDTMHYYSILKTTYKKPIFYNFTYRELAQKTNIHPTTLYNHIKRLKTLNIGEIKDGHLKLTGVNTINKRAKRKAVLKLTLQNTKQETKKQAQYIILCREARRQKKAFKKKSAIVQKCKNKYGKLTRGERKFLKKTSVSQIEKTIQERYTLSNAKLASMLNVSSRTAQRYKKELSKIGFISQYSHFQHLGSVNVFDLKESVLNAMQCSKFRFVTKERFGSEHSGNFDVFLRQANTIVLKVPFHNNTNSFFKENYCFNNNPTSNILRDKGFCCKEIELHILS
jgi:DNA-binding Lrp family transcriptional regulator